MPVVYLGLGSNLGDRAASLRAAIDRLRAGGLAAEAVSSLYESEHVGARPGPVPDYLNCVLRARTDLAPEALLDRTQAVERAGGRTPNYRWGPRAIDVDILLCGRRVVVTDRLVVPHPRLAERAFVLVPLAEMDPELALPGGAPVRELVHAPAVQAQVLRLVARDWLGSGP
jgi:2-amino-4-hydroxy-6-hydroxymethyldihydropteridine diphosphokinase